MGRGSFALARLPKPIRGQGILRQQCWRSTIHRMYHWSMRNALLICLLLGLGMASIAGPPARHPHLRTTKVERPNIVIRGANLYTVEVWAIPTGTEITPDTYVLLGNAKRSNAAGPNETWVFRIPPCNPMDTRLLATEILAKGFDAKGTVIGTKSLLYRGASAVHEALCGTP